MTIIIYYFVMLHYDYLFYIYRLLIYYNTLSFSRYSSRAESISKLSPFCDSFSRRTKSAPSPSMTQAHKITYTAILVGYPCVATVLGRRRRRHPSLDAFAIVVGPTETRQRAGSPFAPYVTGRRPVTRSSHLATSSSMEAHV
jgi:hypothetical protein